MLRRKYRVPAFSGVASVQEAVNRIVSGDLHELLDDAKALHSLLAGPHKKSAAVLREAVDLLESFRVQLEWLSVEALSMQHTLRLYSTDKEQQPMNSSQNCPELVDTDPVDGLCKAAESLMQLDAILSEHSPGIAHLLGLIARDIQRHCESLEAGPCAL